MLDSEERASGRHLGLPPENFGGASEAFESDSEELWEAFEVASG